MTVRQSDLARALGTSEMSVHRLLKALHRNGRPLAVEDITLVFASTELQSLGLTCAVSIEMLTELKSEIRYVAKERSHRCWVIFVESDRYQFRRAALTTTHLQSLIDAHPLSLVLPLHEIVHRAQERLAAMKPRLTCAEAA